MFSNRTSVQPLIAKPLSSGQALFDATKYDSAVSIFNQLIQEDGFSQEAKYWLALCKWRDLKPQPAINDLENPDRVLIGGDDDDSIEALSRIYENWIPKDKIIKTKAFFVSPNIFN